mmetsp:Transcript_25994/g.60105  ORF Transcript_25994/g.60105 Transcript_25994/m.60105 type:complete len:434 (-) Transcript_25994:589-1890(-)
MPCNVRVPRRGGEARILIPRLIPSSVPWFPNSPSSVDSAPATDPGRRAPPVAEESSQLFAEFASSAKSTERLSERALRPSAGPKAPAAARWRRSSRRASICVSFSRSSLSRRAFAFSRRAVDGCSLETSSEMVRRLRASVSSFLARSSLSSRCLASESSRCRLRASSIRRSSSCALRCASPAAEARRPCAPSCRASSRCRAASRSLSYSRRRCASTALRAASRAARVPRRRWASTASVCSRASASALRLRCPCERSISDCSLMKTISPTFRFSSRALRATCPTAVLCRDSARACRASIASALSRRRSRCRSVTAAAILLRSASRPSFALCSSVRRCSAADSRASCEALSSAVDFRGRWMPPSGMAKWLRPTTSAHDLPAFAFGSPLSSLSSSSSASSASSPSSSSKESGASAVLIGSSSAGSKTPLVCETAST